MCGMSPASPDGSRSLPISRRNSRHASRQLKKGGWPPWKDMGLGVCRGCGKEELVKLPSSAELWWLRGAPKPRFRCEVALVCCQDPCPSHTWPNLLPRGHAVPWVHQQASSTSTPPHRPHSPTHYFGTILVLSHASAQPCPRSPGSWTAPLGLGQVSGALSYSLNSFSGSLEWKVLLCFVYLVEVCAVWWSAGPRRLGGQGGGAAGPGAKRRCS